MQSAEVVYRLSHKYSVSAGGQMMWNENSTSLKFVMGDLALGMRLAPGWNAELHLRPIGAADADRRWLPRNLCFATLSWSHRWGKWNVNIRERLQRLGYNEGLFESYRDPKWYNRTRCAIRYQYNYYWSFMANAEGFLALNGSRRYLWDQARLSAGAGYRYNKHWRAECSYGVMQQLNRNTSKQLYFMMLAAHYYFL